MPLAATCAFGGHCHTCLAQAAQSDIEQAETAKQRQQIRDATSMSNLDTPLIADLQN